MRVHYGASCNRAEEVSANANVKSSSIILTTWCHFILLASEWLHKATDTVEEGVMYEREHLAGVSNFQTLGAVGSFVLVITFMGVLMQKARDGYLRMNRFEPRLNSVPNGMVPVEEPMRQNLLFKETEPVLLD